MTPARVKDLLPGLAEQIGIPEEDLSKMLFCYYKENKRIASKLQVNHIILRGLGTLRIKGWELLPRITENEEILRTSKRADLSDIQEELPVLYSALDRWKAEKAAKREMGIKKKQYYNSKNNNNDETQGDTKGSVGE